MAGPRNSDLKSHAAVLVVRIQQPLAKCCHDIAALDAARDRVARPIHLDREPVCEGPASQRQGLGAEYALLDEPHPSVAVIKRNHRETALAVLGEIPAIDAFNRLLKKSALKDVIPAATI